MKTTCQCCGRVIKSNTGLIAHHGYQRPMHWGCQTASCYGAKHLPYEADRRVLGEMLLNMRHNAAALRKTIEHVTNGKIPVQVTVQIRRDGNIVTQAFSLTPETFEKIREENKAAFLKYGFHTFDKARTDNLRRLERTLRLTDAEIEQASKRYDDWQHRIEWIGGGWRGV